MAIKTCLFIVQCIIFCNQYDIIHGQNSRTATEGEFPFVVSLKLIDDQNPRPEKDHVCSGVLITEKNVLTIERCLQEGAVELVVGSINLRAGTKHFPLWWLTYAQWAAMREKPVSFPENELTIMIISPAVSVVAPAVCSTVIDSQLYGSNVVTAGWGALMIGMTPRLMRTATLQVLTNEQCQQKINRLFGQNAFQLQQNYICTNGDHGEFWHLIDFGGPLLYNGRVIAINQEMFPFPTNPPHPDKINVHIRLSSYTDFIRDVIHNL